MVGHINKARKCDGEKAQASKKTNISLQGNETCVWQKHIGAQRNEIEVQVSTSREDTVYTH